MLCKSDVYKPPNAMAAASKDYFGGLQSEQNNRIGTEKSKRIGLLELQSTLVFLDQSLSELIQLHVSIMYMLKSE